MTDDELIAAAYHPETTAALCRSLATSMGNHLQRVQSAKVPVSTWIDPADNIALADEWLQQSPIDGNLDSISTRFDQLVKLSLSRGQNLNHPHYVGHQVPAPLPWAGLFDAVASITNQVQGVYEMGPWAVAAERALIDRIGAAIGYTTDSFGGLVTSGGSLANLTALLTARNKTLADCWTRGLSSSTTGPVIVVNADAHYCVDRAAGVMGLGTAQVVRVPVNALRQMDVQRLDEILTDLAHRKVPVIAVLAVSGATPTGAFDPLEDIHAVCAQHDVWMHVDAAHGGAVCFSSTHRHLVRGLHLADSVVMDAHKMMFMPALCAFVFYKNRQDRFAAFEQSAPYLFDPSAPDMAEYDNGVVTFECTKRAAALGLWGVWSMFGPQLFQALIDKVFATAKRFHDLIASEQDFDTIGTPPGNIVVFRYSPASTESAPPEQIDQLQLAIRRDINRSGQAYLTQTVLAGRIHLRSTMMNPLTQESHLRAIVGQLRSTGQRLQSTTHLQRAET